jgi:selenoprotein W-related protein
LAAEIERARGVAPTLKKGSGGVFDIRRDGALIYSKKATGRFPETAEVLALLRDLRAE